MLRSSLPAWLSASEDNSAELRDNSQSVLKYLRRGVVAIDEDRNFGINA